MLKQYIEFNGKHPRGLKDDRRYSDEINPAWVSYGCTYSDDFLKLDIDDCDHKTGQLEEPIHGKPKSEAVLNLLDDLGIRTENGVHLFFRVPSQMNKKNSAAVVFRYRH